MNAETNAPKPNPGRAVGELVRWAINWIGDHPKQVFWIFGVIAPILGSTGIGVATWNMKPVPTQDSIVVARLDKIDNTITTIALNQVTLSKNQTTTAEILANLSGYRRAEEKVRRQRFERLQDSIRRHELYGPPLWEGNGMDAVPYEAHAGHP